MVVVVVMVVTTTRLIDETEKDRDPPPRAPTHPKEMMPILLGTSKPSIVTTRHWYRSTTERGQTKQARKLLFSRGKDDKGKNL